MDGAYAQAIYLKGTVGTIISMKKNFNAFKISTAIVKFSTLMNEAS